MSTQLSTVVFDLGGVLIDWNPRYLYLELFKGNAASMKHFLSTVCTTSWNEKQDAGRSFAEAEAELKAKHPEHSLMIEAWQPGFDKMLGGSITGTVEILAHLRTSNYPLYALTNWSAEVYPLAEKRFDFLQWFNGIVVSGVEKCAKPDPKIFELMIERYQLTPQSTVYIGDNPPNIATAKSLGFHAIPFTSPQALAQDLASCGIPTQRSAL